MPNIRIIYDNVIDRSLTLTASATAAGLSPANLLVNTKSKVCRSTGTTLTLTATFTNAETFGAVILPFCNLTSNATMQVQVYTNSGDASPAYNVTANAGGGTPFLGLANSVSGVNSFAYGGGAYARMWLPTRPVGKKLVVTITDAGNPSGYVEASRFVAGDYWEPSIGAEVGATMTLADNSKHTRTDAGDQITDRGIRFRKQTFQMSGMNQADRSKLWDILWGNGMFVPVFISQYPNHADLKLEQTNQLYGKLIATPVMSTPYFNLMNATIDIEEI